MPIIVFDEDRFTDAAKETLSHMVYYVDEARPVALLSESCAVFVNSESTDADEITEASAAQVYDVTGSSPDFATYVMDDGCGLVILTNGDAAVLIPKDVIGERDEVPLGMGLEYRALGLTACEDGDIIAMFIPE